MADIKKKMRKIQLAMIFAIIVFLILLVTMFVVFSGIFILQKLGFNLVDEISKVPLLTFAIGQRQRRYSAGFSVQQAASETD